MMTRWLIGLASGSSAERVDAALVETQGTGLDTRVKLIHAHQLPYARDLRDWLLRLKTSQSCDVRHVSLLHRLLGETFARAARHVADEAAISLAKVQALGCPGYTLWHEPEGRFPHTLSLGMAAIVAERTGITTVSDFRSRDVASGGQGLPLGALVEYLLHKDNNENRILVHLGSITRVVYVPAAGRMQNVIGFEAGPCSLLVDGLIRQATRGKEFFDAGGKHAVQGRCLEPLLRCWLDHPYFQRRPPKSFPRNGIEEEFIQLGIQMAESAGINDLLCTATHLAARCLADSTRRFLPESASASRVIFSGGGLRNGLLWHLLEQHLAGMRLEKSGGVWPDACEAIHAALLAALTLDGVPANLPSATGAAAARLLGHLTPGSTANWARCLTWMARQAAPLAGAA